MKPPALETSRLLLRAPRPDDAPAVFACASDPEVTRHLTWGPHATVAESAAYLRERIRRNEEGTALLWGVVPRGGDTLVGACGFRTLHPDEKRAELACVLARACWGRGFGTEAVGAVLRFGFGEMGLGEIYSRALVDNTVSRRMMEKAGMRHVGEEEGAWRGGTTRRKALYVLRRDESITANAMNQQV